MRSFLSYLFNWYEIKNYCLFRKKLFILLISLNYLRTNEYFLVFSAN